MILEIVRVENRAYAVPYAIYMGLGKGLSEDDFGDWGTIETVRSGQAALFDQGINIASSTLFDTVSDALKDHMQDIGHIPYDVDEARELQILKYEDDYYALPTTVTVAEEYQTGYASIEELSDTMVYHHGKAYSSVSHVLAELKQQDEDDVRFMDDEPINEWADYKDGDDAYEYWREHILGEDPIR